MANCRVFKKTLEKNTASLSKSRKIHNYNLNAFQAHWNCMNGIRTLRFVCLSKDLHGKVLLFLILRQWADY